MIQPDFLESVMNGQPLCKFFGSCGGCTAQHMSADAYSAWKEGQVAQILQHNGIKGTLQPIFKGAPYRRRCLTLTIENSSCQQKLGFMVYHSHELVDLTECHLALPEIIERLPEVKTLTALLQNHAKTFRVRLLWSNQGLDVTFLDLPPLVCKQKQRLIEQMLIVDIIRLSIDNEILLEKAKPCLTYGTVEVELPPAIFVQADAIAEGHMIAIANEHLQKCKTIVELFCGAGSFTFPLLEYMSVHAVESNEAALAALLKAYKIQNHGLKKLTYERRDLVLRPLRADELNGFDGLLFDPPRAGAKAQAAEIAKSNIKKIVAVSCNIATLVEDIKILQQGGYHIDKIIPIDQFLWSNHCEMVVLLSKKTKRTGWSL
ncbi:RNA methyltransferase [Bartonella sp. TP]|uniref:class I SAM-dependent RNA methyltransferase n=1 Tax=Bartonella sp. TP TaxID=3057550 RepID=UPI0025B10C74|nr:RNA methyltransferase [Bartonella sp. TP]WJW80191.1 RNA methyltransferase [Bartonella sp. TP]